MTPEEFLREFGALAETDGGIERLRNCVLQLAVMGKLVRQESTDEPVQIGGCSAEVPPGWRSCWLEDVVSRTQKISYGVLVPGPHVEGGTPLVRVQDLTLSSSAEPPTRRISPDVAKSYSRTRLEGGELLLAVVGTIGRVGIAPASWKGANIARAVCRIAPGHWVEGRYLACVLRAPSTQEYFRSSTRTLAQPTLNVAHIRSAKVLLPPLPEQKRIVEKVDQLMALCDELEAAQKKRRATSFLANKAALSALTSATGTKPVKEAWKRVQDNFEVLYDAPETVEDLRQSILQLAVMGKLVRAASAEPHRVRDLARLQNGYAFKSEWFSDRGLRLLRNANVGHGKLDWSDEVRLPHSRSAEFRRFELSPGDIVLSLDRPLIKTGLKYAVVDATDTPCLLLQRVARFQSLAPDLTRDFLLLWLQSPLFTQAIDPGRSNGVPHISTKQVEALSIPLLRPDDQLRTCAATSRLLALCDELDALLQRSRVDGEPLMKAVVEHLVVAPQAPSEPIAMVG